MMWQEFEKLAGYEVTYEDYHNIIEPMYMATEMSKQDFIKCLDSKRFSIQYKKAQLKKELTKTMKEQAELMKAYCGHCDTYEVYIALRDACQQYIKEFESFSVEDADWERGYEYEGAYGCSYIKAIVWRDLDGKVIHRIKLVA